MLPGFQTPLSFTPKIGGARQFPDIPVEHTDFYKIVIVLDESASMSNVANSMRKALNDLISEQKTIKRKCFLTLVKFNQDVRRVIKSKNLQNIRELTEEDYRPSGSTALYDAVGDTINWFRYESNVLLVVITDGQENSSTKYKKSAVMNMLKEKETHRGWTYVYLGCDLSVAAQGDSMGFKKSNMASNCCVPQQEYSSFVQNDLNKAIFNHRTRGISVQAQLNSKY